MITVLHTAAAVSVMIHRASIGLVLLAVPLVAYAAFGGSSDEPAAAVDFREVDPELRAELVQDFLMLKRGTARHYVRENAVIAFVESNDGRSTVMYLTSGANLNYQRPFSELLESIQRIEVIPDGRSTDQRTQ